MALEPPVTLPLGTGIGGAVSVALATNCQLCLLVKRESGMARQRPQGRHAYAGVKAKLDLIGKMVKLGVVRPGFQEEHGPLLDPPITGWRAPPRLNLLL